MSYFNKYYSNFEEHGIVKSGHFFSYFDAVSKADKKHYAIKKIPFDETDRAKTVKEIEILSTLNSEFVVKFIDSWIEKNYYISTYDKINKKVSKLSAQSFLSTPVKPLLLYIQSELSLCSLENIIQNFNNLKYNSICKKNYIIATMLLHQLLESVNYLHKKSIIHRNLNPTNVLLMSGNQNRCVKIADFGLSIYHKLEEQQSRSKYKESKVYRAPEISIGQFDNTVDVYSIGLIIQELFCLDINNDSVFVVDEIRDKFLNIFDICVKCLDPKPKNRPSCQKLLDEKDLWACDDTMNLIVWLKSIESLNKERSNILFNYEAFSREHYFESNFLEFGALNNGQTATVFKVKSCVDGKFYAIKKIPCEEKDIDKTFKKIEILSKLSSDYALKYIDHWVEPNYYIGVNDGYILSSNLYYNNRKPFLLHTQSELCSSTLKDLIKILKDNEPANSLKLENYALACDIFTQLLECVDYLHRLKPRIIHRDLKPENIILSDWPNNRFVKLIDFGVSTYHEFVDLSHTHMDESLYRAPELSTINYTTKADIYSLGRIMQELFNFDINIDANNVEAVIRNKYKKLKSISIACLEIDASKRPNCKGILEMRHTWAHTLRGETFINRIKAIENEKYQVLFNTDFEEYKNAIQNPDTYSKALMHYFDRKKVICDNYDALRNLIDLNKLIPALINLLPIIDRNMSQQRIESSINKLKYITDEDMIKKYILQEYVDLNDENEFQIFIQILLHTSHDNLALKLYPQCIDMCDITRCNPKDGFVSQFSFGLYNKRDTLKHKNPLSAENCYPMDKSPRGLCYIVNNYFTVGTYREMQRFQNIFYQLHFKVIMEKNLSANELRNSLSMLSKHEELNKHNAFVFMITTHGNEFNQILGIDEVPIDIDEIVDTFSNQNCPKLQDKPKIFFLNCCRANVGVPKLSLLDQIMKKRLPDNSNFIVCYSSLDYYVGYVDWYKGTLSGQAFADMLVESAWCDDLNAILIKTKIKLDKSAKHLGYKNIFEMKSVLIQLIKFFPFVPYEIKLVDKQY